MTGSLRGALADYLALRRALGYRLDRPEKLLDQFLAHLEATHQEVVSIQNALEWAQQPAHGGPSWWGYRLSVVRGFATYLPPWTRRIRCRPRNCCHSGHSEQRRTCTPTPTSLP